MDTDMSGSDQASTSASIGHASATSEEEQLWEEENDYCFLCDQPLEPSKSCVVKERGIANFIKASIKRKDKKDVTFKKLKEITIHKTCQNMYVRESNIKMAIQLRKKKWTACRQLSEDGRQFNFSTNCFFCSKCMYPAQTCRRVSKQSCIDNVLAQLRIYPKNEENKVILSRLVNLKDKEDKYYIDNIVRYHSKCSSAFYKYSPTHIKGKPMSEKMTDLLSFIINYILENSEECQFSLKMILQKYTSKHGPIDFPRLDRIERHLKQHFDDEIVIYKSNNDRFICFKQTLGKSIDENWYANRKTNNKEEKLRIVELAAHIILQDVRSMKFDTENYNSPTDFLNNVADDIPETLKLFLDILVKTHKHDPNNGCLSKWENRICTLSHILMSSVRPRSFSSPILLGLSCMMHTKFSAKELIDCLYNIGLCASHSETVRLESSLVNDPESLNLISDTCLQFVYDNADHDTETID